MQLKREKIGSVTVVPVLRKVAVDEGSAEDDAVVEVLMGVVEVPIGVGVDDELVDVTGACRVQVKLADFCSVDIISAAPNAVSDRTNENWLPVDKSLAVTGEL
jgi:hypothetical protein